MFNTFNQNQPEEISPFFEGENIFSNMNKSTFGRIKKTIDDMSFEKDLEKYILPKIIVIGNESSGKSSLLENIAKMQIFPRGISQCTKCPVRVIMSNGRNQYSISFSLNSEEHTVNLQNKNDFFGEITRHMNMLKDITEDEIIVRITEPNMVPLELIDLPGIVSYPPVMAKKTIDISKKYLSCKNTIVLCVVPATVTRLTSCQSIALISEMKMEEKCILALTMIDCVQNMNMKELVINRITQTSAEIKYSNLAGCIAIINRCNTSINSLDVNNISEIKWFSDNILVHIPDKYTEYKHKIKNSITVTNLIYAIDKLYTKIIDNIWKTKILKLLEKKLDEQFGKYDSLGKNITINMLDDINSHVHSIIVSCYDLYTPVNESDIDKTKNDNQYDSDYVEARNIYEYYNFIDDYMSKKSNCDMEIMIKHITLEFQNDTKYKLIRFGYLLEKITNEIKIEHTNLINRNRDMINNMMREYIMWNYLNKKHLSLENIKNKLDTMYRLCVIFPLLTKKAYTMDDFVESEKHIHAIKCIEHNIDDILYHMHVISKITDTSIVDRNQIYDIKIDLNNYRNVSNNTVKLLEKVSGLDFRGCENITDEGISKLINLTSLECCENITDEGISKLINLTSLICYGKNITDEGISKLINLTSLDCGYCKNITDEGISKLINLTSLDCYGCKNITDEGISKLINLTSLVCHGCKNITDEGISKLINLTSLVCRGCENITDEGISKLINLTSLVCRGCENITDEGISKLINLTSLDCEECKNITDEGISKLINLTSLDCEECENITDEGISKLINLTSLVCHGCKNITDEGISKLINLTSLQCWGCNITDEGISKLINLLVWIAGGVKT
jgi:GTP-binding protein EngB required for normal cell division